MALRTIGKGGAGRAVSYKELEQIGIDPRKPIDNPEEVLQKLGKGGETNAKKLSRGWLGLATGNPEERKLALEYDALKAKAWKLFGKNDPTMKTLTDRMHEIEEIRSKKGYANESLREGIRGEMERALSLKAGFKKELAAEKSGDKIPLEKQTKAMLAKALSERGLGHQDFLVKEKLSELKKQADSYNKYGKQHTYQYHLGEKTNELIAKVQDNARRRYGITSWEKFNKAKQNPKFSKLEQEWKDYVGSYGGNIPPSKMKEASRKIHALYRQLAQE